MDLIMSKIYYELNIYFIRLNEHSRHAKESFFTEPKKISKTKSLNTATIS